MKTIGKVCLALILVVAVLAGNASAIAKEKIEVKAGTTFKACGLEWHVGKADLDWNQSQKWIKELGDNWRAPTKVDLIKLFAEKGQKSPFGQDFVWAEARDAHSAWYFSFYFQEIRWSYYDDSSKFGRAGAVRDVK